MERWVDKVAVVTGASSGIGWAVAQDLLKAGMIVIGFARRLQKMEDLKETLDVSIREKFYPRCCDLTVLPSLKSNFHWIEQRFHSLHVLVNNAGMVQMTKVLEESNESTLKQVIDVNLMGTVNCTKQAYRLMQATMAKGEACHIVTVSSLLGHTVPLHIPECGLNLYPVTKHALHTLHEVLRRELFPHKLMRLSSISPGLTRTDFGGAPSDDEKKKWEELIEPDEILLPEDVARGVNFILSSPPHVTIADLLMVPARERY
ncbi:PREDICTED: farnesol dehydrogenase-like [Rhagoletis zephyria]|uniref:farnesol dehydrogenase-like n=1 Tax=Rhagoletis zephyria TaxID=28612 RepID=UPI0008117727|nr:PREDICTED: farnesol dehydrogenase-like [Rhagoletis zephyria]XP_036339364.1 farnesol dehydrogenase-like [Rhagoletis pomonella]